jgi:hypothetical protein
MSITLLVPFFDIFRITYSFFLQQDNKLQKIEINQFRCDRLQDLSVRFYPVRDVTPS